MSRVAVIGAGSWGTAVAFLLADAGHEIVLWDHTPESAQAINEAHHNPRYLSDVVLEGVRATSSIEEAVYDAEAVCMVTPSVTVRQIAGEVAPHLGRDVPVAMLSKGVEADTGLLLTDILAEVLGNPARIAAISGPNHAEEVSKRIPSATVVASAADGCARFFQDLFMTPDFRVYTSRDVCGVELCAACKNIIAIGNGISVGIGYGDNTTAMVITRGLAEMSRLVKALGGDPLTCMGLAGMGDLIATCTSPHSRNRTLGSMIARGQTLDDFIAQTHMVAEGAVASKAVTALARRNDIELPISEVVRGILWEGLAVEQEAALLMNRAPKSELHGIVGRED